ncbi:unnamed protein product [Blepharisma stoltei]|uniref:NADP-dependent oxidoreductase domain-containing protein n=1 Tax=Blepharisma stoltei TaxID=1481888 RepID=A0AAU9J295_9CILI|nr:unnamed protein product [Blepharisma stoltei]
MRNSLKRLQLGYVDAMYLHRYDQEVPLEETIRAVNHLIEKGKADYWGTSEFTALEIQEWYKISDKYGFIRPVVDQCQYSLIVRDKVEVEFPPLFDKYGMGAVAWSPLMGGFLSGKYNDMSIPEGSRLADPSLPQIAKKPYESFFLPENQEKTRKLLGGLGELASEIGCSQSQLALAWCLKNNDISSAIFGATKLYQAEDNLGAIDALSKLTPEILAKIEEIFDTRPKPPINWRNWQSMPSRR